MEKSNDIPNKASASSLQGMSKEEAESQCRRAIWAAVREHDMNKVKILSKNGCNMLSAKKGICSISSNPCNSDIECVKQAEGDLCIMIGDGFCQRVHILLFMMT